MTFGERLRYLREEKELRQQDVADILNISPRMIGYYESDQHFPSDAQMIINIAKFFNVSLDFLFGISNIKNSAILREYEILFSELSEENKASALKYMKYLKDLNGFFIQNKQVVFLFLLFFCKDIVLKEAKIWI